MLNILAKHKQHHAIQVLFAKLNFLDTATIEYQDTSFSMRYPNLDITFSFNSDEKLQKITLGDVKNTSETLQGALRILELSLDNLGTITRTITTKPDFHWYLYLQDNIWFSLKQEITNNTNVALSIGIKDNLTAPTMVIRTCRSH